MSKEFIEQKVNSSDLYLASEQQKQLSYFTESCLQDSYLSEDYIEQWANRKYQSNDYFLNWIKSIFKTENFLLFFKYMRKPLASTILIKNKIEPNLQRVLYAENASFSYNVTNISDDKINDLLKPSKFNDEIFYRLLYRHNDLIVTDVSGKEAIRYFLNIEDVISIDVENDTIYKIAFGGELENEKGYIVIDTKGYSFFNKDLTLISFEPHKLGYCPVFFVSNKNYKDSQIVKESLFTFIREELEEYVFLKTLQKIMYPNGVFPTAVKPLLHTESESDTVGQEPNYESMRSQFAGVESDNNPTTGGVMQTGTVHEIEIPQKIDGSYDLAIIDSFLKLHYIPTDVIRNIDERIESIKNSIVSTVIGDQMGGNESAKNETQIEKGISALENNLLTTAKQLNRIRKLSDKAMLQLQWDKRFNSLFIFYGSDFYLDSIDTLMKNFEFAPNPIERKDVLVRINNNKYKNQPDKQSRTNLLYNLLPFCADVDFQQALSLNRVSETVMDYQLRFSYWIEQFEALYGDIVVFYNSIDSEKNGKLILINNLITNIIVENGSSTR